MNKTGKGGEDGLITDTARQGEQALTGVKGVRETATTARHARRRYN